MICKNNGLEILINTKTIRGNVKKGFYYLDISVNNRPSTAQCYMVFLCFLFLPYNMSGGKQGIKFPSML